MTLSTSIILDLLFQRTLAGYGILVGLAALAVLLAARSPALRFPAALVFWIMAWTVADVLGYAYVVRTNETSGAVIAADPGMLAHYQVSLNAYRIIQVTFQIVLTLAVVFAASWRVGLAALVFWWGGACDVLYFPFARRAFPGSWDWLGWTPAGMVVRELSFPLVVAQALAGTVIATVLVKLALSRHANARAPSS